MRRGTPTDPTRYVQLRINMLQEELEKNPEHNTQLIILKAIDELQTVLQLLQRNGPAVANTE